MFTGTLVAAFYYLALYKFNSINRYIGYCKMINLEIYAWSIKNPEKKAIPPIAPENIITWELCVSMLANSAMTSKPPVSYWSKLKFRGISQETMIDRFNKYNLNSPEVDRNSSFNGALILLKGIRKRDKSVSWKYPLYSAYIYYVLIFFFVGLAFLNIYRFIIVNSNYQNIKIFFKPEIIIVLILLLVIRKVLVKSFSEIHKLMIGSKTVSAYCWKFLIYRIKALNKLDIEPEYLQTED